MAIITQLLLANHATVILTSRLTGKTVLSTSSNSITFVSNKANIRIHWKFIQNLSWWCFLWWNIQLSNLRSGALNNKQHLETEVRCQLTYRFLLMLRNNFEFLWQFFVLQAKPLTLLVRQVTPLVLLFDKYSTTQKHPTNKVTDNLCGCFCNEVYNCQTFESGALNSKKNCRFTTRIFVNLYKIIFNNNFYFPKLRHWLCWYLFDNVHTRQHKNIRHCCQYEG